MQKKSSEFQATENVRHILEELIVQLRRVGYQVETSLGLSLRRFVVRTSVGGHEGPLHDC